MEVTKPELCTCNKRFKTNNALLQHQRDSSRHVGVPQTHKRDSPLPVDAPQTSRQTMSLQELVQRASLQEPEGDYGVRRADWSKIVSSAKCIKFIPFSGGGPTTFLARNPDLSYSSWSEIAPKQVMAGEKKVFIAAGTKKEKKQKKKTERGNIPNRDGGSSWQSFANTRENINFYEEQNWGLCDKDCGWCGHCGDGIL